MMQNSQQLSSSMPPHLSPAHMENPNQNTTSSPQLSAQGYSHQLQSSAWAGNKVCHATIGQNSNMEAYPQQVTNRFYPGTYASHQNAEMTRYMNSAPNSHHSVPAAYGTQYAVARQTNYPAPGTQNYQASMNNCGNAYYGNINSQNAYGMSNIVSQQRKYANSPLCPSRTTQGLPQNMTQMAHNKIVPQQPSSSAYAKQPIQHTRYVGNYNMLSSESQPNCGIRHQLTSPSVSISTNQDSPPALTAAVQSVNVQLSSIPTPPEASSIPGDLTPANDGSTLDVSVDSSKLNQVSSSSFALPGTTVTHSVGNMSSATLALTTSVGNSIESSRTQVRTQGSALQPPPNMDEGSQASSASASSSIPDDQNSIKANSKPNFSYPPTPNTLSSPGAASMSSFHDELECISSPGWPRTPASPVANNNYEFSNVKRPDSLMKLYNLSEDPDRRYFLDKLLIFNEDRGSPITQCPTISKQPLDVYRVYLAVKERGGFVEVTNAKRWKDIAGAIGVGASSSAAYTLRKQYMKLLLPFECKFDRGGIDPQPIINQVEASSRKKGKAANTSGNQNPCNQAYPQAIDNYHPSGYPTSYHPPSRHHCSTGNMDYHCAPNHVHYPQSSHHPRPAANGVVPAQTQYGQYWHSSQAYGYYQGNNSSIVPVHNNTQATVNGTMCRYANNASSQAPEQEYYSHHYASHSNQAAPTNSSFNNRNKGQESIVSAGHYPLNRTAGEQEPLNSRSPYPSADTTVNTTVQTPGDHYSSRRTVEEEPFGVPSGSSCHSSGTVVRDSVTCYNSNYSSNKTVVTPSQDQCTAASGNCTPVKPVVQTAPQSYQQPIVESNMNKTFQPVCHNTATTAVSCHGSSSNFSPSYYPNQQAPSQADYQPKTLNQANQYGQYVQTQNENYRGSEGPPNFQNHQTDHRGVCSSTDSPSTDQMIYQTSSVPPTKPNNFATYSQPQTTDQEQYNVVASNEQYNRSTRGWASDSHCQYQLPSVQATFPHDPQITSSDVKYCPETPRIAKPWPVTCDTPQTEVKPPAPSSVCAPALTFSPNKNQTHSVSAVPSICLQPSPRKTIDFPLDSVESTTPVLAKRKRYTSKDVSPLEAWRLMMALKSGLLGECTWALDVLSVLLCDNNSIVYFGLSHLPGLLEVLVEHYRYFLNIIFNLANDLEIGYKHVGQKNSKGINANACNLPKEHLPNGFCEPKSSLGIDWREKTTLFNTRNYTYRTRCKKPVRIKADEALFLIDPERKWDTFEGFSSGTEHWQIGGGETTMHIQAGFEDVSGHVKFARNFDDEKEFKAKQKTEKKRTSAIVKNLPDCLKEYNLQSLKLPLLSFKGEPIVVLEKCCIKNIKAKHSHQSSSDNDSDTEMEDNESLFASAKETTSDKNIQKKALDKELMKKDSSENVKFHETKNPVINAQQEEKTSEKKPLTEVKPQVSYSPIFNSSELAKNLHPSTHALQKENINTATENQTSVNKNEKHSIVDESSVSDVVHSPKKNDALLPELQNNEGSENIEDFAHSSFPRFRSTPSPRKRVLSEDLEEEAYCRDEPALFMSTESQDALAKRCICISTILRNLSFVPGNDLEMKKHSCFLLILGRLLLLHHEHKPVKATHRKYDKEVEGNSLDDSCISLKEDYEWWWDMLHILRDNTLVTLSNIAGQLDLTPFPEEISLPILDGLLHWVVCPSSYAQDPMPTQPASSVLSPQRLSLEALCKLSVLGNNVDLMIATPPWSRIERLFAFLTKSLNLRQDQVVREFALVLLSNLSQADPSAARTIAEQNSCISYLIAFVEQAESSAFQIASFQGIKTLRENPELMGTTPDMVQRAASILKSLACIPENQRLFFRHQHRLLALVTSQIIDQAVASIIADVLFYCSEDKSGPSSGISLTAS